MVVSVDLCSTAQNLVPNPSFEEHGRCPFDFNQGSLGDVKDWTQAGRGTVDYFHSCSRNMGIPENVFGIQEAMDGQAYLGLITYTPTKRNYREYMQVELNSALEAGGLYCLSMYVCLAEGSRFYTDGLGAMLSTSQVGSDKQTVIPMDAQLKNPRAHYLDKTEDWTYISDIIKAEGGERYLTIGNFLPDHELKVRKRNMRGADKDNPWEHSYYFIDAVTLTPVDGPSECRSTIAFMERLVRDKVRWSLSPGEQVDLDNVLFDFDQSNLTTQAIRQLDEVAGRLLTNEFLYLEVIGHTDVIGPDGYNLGLSKERAEQVMDHLVSLGVPARRLSIRYSGEHDPVADNSTAEGRTQNRRVDFVIYERSAEEYVTDP